MSKEIITKSNLWSSQGKWKGMNATNKILHPKGRLLKVGKSKRHLVSKGLKAIESLGWNEAPRYCKNSSLH